MIALKTPANSTNRTIGQCNTHKQPLLLRKSMLFYKKSKGAMKRKEYPFTYESRDFTTNHLQNTLKRWLSLEYYYRSTTTNINLQQTFIVLFLFLPQLRPASDKLHIGIWILLLQISALCNRCPCSSNK